jgi:hypothetical protein
VVMTPVWVNYFPGLLTKQEVRVLWKPLVTRLHPDKETTGNKQLYYELQRQREIALKNALGGRMIVEIVEPTEWDEAKAERERKERERNSKQEEKERLGRAASGVYGSYKWDSSFQGGKGGHKRQRAGDADRDREEADRANRDYRKEDEVYQDEAAYWEDRARANREYREDERRRQAMEEERRQWSAAKE